MRDKAAGRGARLEITEQLYRYCRAVDRGDWEALGRLYHADAIEHHGPYRGGLDGFIDFNRSMAKNPAMIWQHHLTTINITVVGGVAYSEAYFNFSGRTAAADENGVGRMSVIDGRYVDRFEQRNGEWRIARRVAVVDFVRHQAVQDDEFAATFARGASGRSDPSFWDGLTPPAAAAVG